MELNRDQATTLRSMVKSAAKNTASVTSKVIAVASGKGGAGKTNLVANLSIAFARMGRRVLALDGDLGLANLDLALGISPKYNVLDLLEQRATIDEIITEAPEGVSVLPGCSGRFELANLSDQTRYNFFQAIDQLENRYDTLLIDTCAGIGSNAIEFAAAAQDVVVIANMEPTSQADAYAFIKVLSNRSNINRMYLVANMVRNLMEGEQVFKRLSGLAERFLGVSLVYIGCILQDKHVSQSIQAGIPLLVAYPKSLASQCVENIARKLVSEKIATHGGGIQLFWKRFLEADNNKQDRA